NGRPHGRGPVEGSLMSWLLERGFPGAATVLLDQQNRMHPSIGELVSRVFYGGRVATGPAAPRERLPLEALPDPVTWIDTRALAACWSWSATPPPCATGASATWSTRCASAAESLRPATSSSPTAPPTRRGRSRSAHTDSPGEHAAPGGRVILARGAMEESTI